jgi:hypothetical protein
MEGMKLHLANVTELTPFTGFRGICPWQNGQSVYQVVGDIHPHTQIVLGESAQGQAAHLLRDFFAVANARYR